MAGKLDLNAVKLCVLYALEGAGIALTRQQLDGMLIGHLRLHYFDVSLAVAHLTSSALIEEMETSAGRALRLLPAGRRVIEELAPTLPKRLSGGLNDYLDAHGDELRREAQTGADYRCVAHSQYLAELWITEGTVEILRLRLNVPTAEEARALCANWRERAPGLYAHILTTLLGQEAPE
jgi:hypothetical protein